MRVSDQESELELLKQVPRDDRWVAWLTFGRERERCLLGFDPIDWTDTIRVVDAICVVDAVGTVDRVDAIHPLGTILNAVFGADAAFALLKRGRYLW
jgi:hypothetical protein